VLPGKELVMGDGRSLPLALFLVLVLAASGCATLGPRTSGADGPIEWRAVDLKLDRQDQSSSWVYSFVLELRDQQGRRLWFTEMERHIYQPGTGTGSSTVRSFWALPPGGVLRLPLQSSLRCGRAEGNCLGNLMPIPLWRITLTGTDADGRPVRTVVDLRLPADPPGSK
jgi:hypothetical protein